MSKKKQAADMQILPEQMEELESKWKRALADYQNLEKRVMLERSQFVKLATVGVVEKFIGVLDDLELAAKHVNDEGLNMVIKKFVSVLQSEGVKEIEADGKPFDPHLMEAVDRVAGPKDMVINIVKKGYQIDTTVVRPAQVTVGMEE